VVLADLFGVPPTVWLIRLLVQVRRLDVIPAKTRLQVPTGSWVRLQYRAEPSGSWAGYRSVSAHLDGGQQIHAAEYSRSGLEVVSVLGQPWRLDMIGACPFGTA